MKRKNLLSLLLVSMVFVYGCDGSSSKLSKAQCQQNYEVSKNKALDAYENCSRSNCNGQVIMTQGQNDCTAPCFSDLKDARATIDGALSTCLSNATN